MIEMDDLKDDCEHLAPSGSDSLSEEEGDIVYVKKKKNRNYLNRLKYGGGGAKSRSRCRFSMMNVFVAILFFWVIGLKWFIYSVVLEVRDLTNLTRKINSEHVGMRSSINSSYTLAGELSRNLTDVESKYRNVQKVLTNDSLSLKDLRLKESELEKRVNVTPELVGLPSTLHALMGSVAGIGSQMEDFNTTITKMLKELGSVRIQMEDLRDSGPRNRTGFSDRMGLVKAQLSAMNDTLWSHVHMMTQDEKNLQETVSKLKRDFEQYFPTERAAGATAHKNWTRDMRYESLSRHTTVKLTPEKITTVKKS